MYESPIELIDRQLYDYHRQLQEQKENYIYQAIQSYDVNVNKEELIKALNYDREQYETGYKEASHRIKEYIVEKIRGKQIEYFNLYNEYRDGEDYRKMQLLEEVIKIVAEAY